jgi:hypothetical protein
VDRGYEEAAQSASIALNHATGGVLPKFHVHSIKEFDTADDQVAVDAVAAILTALREGPPNGAGKQSGRLKTGAGGRAMDAQTLKREDKRRVRQEKQQEKTKSGCWGITTCVYLHCRAGHGRTGMIAALTLAVIYPTVPVDRVMALVQMYHDHRVDSWHGWDTPETHEQRVYAVKMIARARASEWPELLPQCDSKPEL